jgi:3-phenylpropionate/trans-cinnamate dioxygenase ferredoxin component
MSNWVDVASAEDLPPGGQHVVVVEGVRIAVFNLTGRYFAIEDLCTHDGAPLAGGIVQGDEVICPRHGARFCIRTGEALSPPAYEPVPTFPVRVTDGMVQVRDERWD